VRFGGVLKGVLPMGKTEPRDDIFSHFFLPAKSQKMTFTSRQWAEMHFQKRHFARTSVIFQLVRFVNVLGENNLACAGIKIGLTTMLCARLSSNRVDKRE